VRNVTVTNCILSCNSNGFKLGNYKTAVGFRDVTLSNRTVIAPRFHTDYERIDRYAHDSRVYGGDRLAGEEDMHTGISLYSADGGRVENLTITNVAMRGVAMPLLVLTGDQDRGDDVGPGELRNVAIDDVVATDTTIPGIQESHVENVTISNYRATVAGGMDDPDAVADRVPDLPEQSNLGTRWAMHDVVLPAYGVYCRRADDISLDNVTVEAETEDVRAAVAADDVSDLHLNGVSARGAGHDGPLVALSNVRGTLLRGIHASEPVDTGVVVEGGSRITVAASDLRATETAVGASEDAAEDVALVGCRT